MRCILQRTYLKNLSFFFFSRLAILEGYVILARVQSEQNSSAKFCALCLRFLSCQRSIPLRRKFFSNCATLISSCALRRVPHFIQPPFLPSSSIPSRRFVAARGTDTRGIYTLYEIGKRIHSMQMDTIGRKKELEIERFFFLKR